jgi:ATP-dependent Lon protease
VLGVPPDFAKTRDVHVHLPAGATPKDGPSAGIALATAIVSALTGTPVRGDVAMTGEITLRGRVLPIGGVKEKVLGAHRAGIRRVILPKRNEADLDDIPPDLRRQMQFVMVESIDEVLREALSQTPAAEPPGNGAGDGATAPEPVAAPAEGFARARRARSSRPAAPAQ